MAALPRGTEGFPGTPDIGSIQRSEYGAEPVALAYRQVIKEDGENVARHSENKAQKRWDPSSRSRLSSQVTPIDPHNPTGTGGNVFCVIRPLANGVATRSAKAVSSGDRPGTRSRGSLSWTIACESLTLGLTTAAETDRSRPSA